MNLAAEIAALRADIEQIKRSRKSGKRRQIALSVRIDPETDARVRLIAQQQGVTLGSIMREALAYIVSQRQLDLPDIPARFHAHRKPDRFDDGKTDIRDRNQASAREQISRDIGQRQTMIETGAAVLAQRTQPTQRLLGETMSETVARPLVPNAVPKPSR